MNLKERWSLFIQDLVSDGVSKRRDRRDYTVAIHNLSEHLAVPLKDYQIPTSAFDLDNMNHIVFSTEGELWHDVVRKLPCVVQNTAPDDKLMITVPLTDIETIDGGGNYAQFKGQMKNMHEFGSWCMTGHLDGDVDRLAQYIQSEQRKDRSFCFIKRPWHRGYTLDNYDETHRMSASIAASIEGVEPFASHVLRFPKVETQLNLEVIEDIEERLQTWVIVGHAVLHNLITTWCKIHHGFASTYHARCPDRKGLIVRTWPN